MFYGPTRIFSNYGASAADVTDARQSAESAQRRVKELEAQVDKLTIICAAMWELLQQKTGLTEQDLADRMTEVDLRDGTADGKMTNAVLTCSKCGRRVASHHRRCLYCGEEQQFDRVFDTIR